MNSKGNIVENSLLVVGGGEEVNRIPSARHSVGHLANLIQISLKIK